MSKPLRSLRNVRTQANLTGGQRPRHKLYMQMTTLEMERARRAEELRVARERTAAIEQRLAEIEIEVSRLEALAAAAPVGIEASGPADVRRRQATGFILRY